jgi:hypothetical protein
MTMKVENPKYHFTGRRKGQVICNHCPVDENTVNGLRGTGICGDFRGSDGKSCPTKTTYQEACTLADKAIAAKEGME